MLEYRVMPERQFSDNKKANFLFKCEKETEEKTSENTSHNKATHIICFRRDYSLVFSSIFQFFISIVVSKWTTKGTQRVNEKERERAGASKRLGRNSKYVHDFTNGYKWIIDWRQRNRQKRAKKNKQTATAVYTVYKYALTSEKY